MKQCRNCRWRPHRWVRLEPAGGPPWHEGRCRRGRRATRPEAPGCRDRLAGPGNHFHFGNGSGQAGLEMAVKRGCRPVVER
ncbi:MAG: hypothetical protein LBU64_04430 [Planctomycetota bacterium]|nr:hypothetical protein [Planctomycetota bacterium]